MIYLHMSGEVEGPFTADELKELWNLGQVTPDAAYWYRGMKTWAPVTDSSRSIRWPRARRPRTSG